LHFAGAIVNGPGAIVNGLGAILNGPGAIVNDSYGFYVHEPGACLTDPCARIRSSSSSIAIGRWTTSESCKEVNDKAGCNEGIRQNFSAIDSRSIVRISFFARRGKVEPGDPEPDRYWKMQIGLIGKPADVAACSTVEVTAMSSGYSEISLSDTQLKDLSRECSENLGHYGVTGLVLTKTGIQNRTVYVDDFSVVIGSNSITGYQALYSNTEGYGNTANGYQALYSGTAGIRNTAVGDAALYNAEGNNNVALGYAAGGNITTGNHNIMIGTGQKGQPADNGVIRIGSMNDQNKAFVAGIWGSNLSLNAVPVVVDAYGQLGTMSSSRRVKEDIQPMGSVSERLFDLRPVTFRYKQPYEDGGKPVQFGLVAEEVAQVFPELVIYAEDGEPETVSYHLLATLLLNEFQKERSAAQAQASELAQLKEQMAAMAALIERLGHAQMPATIH
jgi:hypothetical protein